MPFNEILENGIIKLKDNSYVKIIRIQPINFNLKSELEKQAILNSYKLFLKTCNFNIQILIQSKKENLLNYISKIKNDDESEKIKSIEEDYIKFIKKLNNNKNSSSKNFFILIKKSLKEKEINIITSVIIEELNEQFFKIKDCLSRCGNTVTEINNKNEIKEILNSIFNIRLYEKGG